MKVLIIAYSFYPEKNVGAIRTSYWAQELSKLPDVEVEVITKCQSSDSLSYKYTTVKPQRSSIFQTLIQDEGLGWKKDILAHFNAITPKPIYDVLIISGGPFLHFGLGRKFKTKGWAKKVILDYRDPFSYNPRFKDGKLKIAIKKLFEVRMNFGADIITSVNDMCLDYISNWSGSEKIVLPNGYDERFFPDLTSLPEFDSNKTIVYPGKFYWHSHAFFNVVSRLDMRLLHVGSQDNLDNSDLISNYKYQGFIAQQEMADFLLQGKIGVIFLSDTPFESTTKVFDYLAMNMAILIITKGPKKIGVMQELLAGYENVFWANENEEEISEGLVFLQNLELNFLGAKAKDFSRKASFLKLLNMIEYGA